jgi:hypothetical protein
MPKALRLEPTPDMPRRVAILWGPLVLAGNLGRSPTEASAKTCAARCRRRRP